jgi:xanthine dehydrogenase YagS FAD-binding subunit
MNEFGYAQASNTADAARHFAAGTHAKYLGGGTNLIDLMRETIEQPDMLVDVTALSQTIEARDDGSLIIGAAAKNTAVASHAAVRTRFPMLARAILSGASGQIRNMATTGGNLLQRTRCHYFYDHASRCNKRDPGAGCDAIEGFNRMHAILGTSPSCVATHPSDMAVALVALDTILHVAGKTGERELKLTDLHRLPGGRPDRETTLAADELITAIEIPPLPCAANSTYRKVRDRASYAFALVSVAAAIDVGADGRIGDVRVALGGVAPKPWRAWKAEAVLKDADASAANFRRAAEAELDDAAALRDNGFKIELAARVITATLSALSQESRS